MASLKVSTLSVSNFEWGHSGGGIWSVDGRFIPPGPVQSIFVAPGKRLVGYSCPDRFYSDAAMPPTLKYNFEANKSYEIVINCNNKTYIQLATPGA